MIQLDLKLALPDSLAQEAEAAGLLTPQAIEALLRDAVRRRRVAMLFEMADRLAGVGMQPLTEAEVEAEIQAARSERRTLLKLKTFQGIQILTAPEFLSRLAAQE